MEQESDPHPERGVAIHPTCRVFVALFISIHSIHKSYYYYYSHILFNYILETKM